MSSTYNHYHHWRATRHAVPVPTTADADAPGPCILRFPRKRPRIAPENRPDMEGRDAIAGATTQWGKYEREAAWSCAISAAEIMRLANAHKCLWLYLFRDDEGRISPQFFARAAETGWRDVSEPDPNKPPALNVVAADDEEGGDL